MNSKKRKYSQTILPDFIDALEKAGKGTITEEITRCLPALPALKELNGLVGLADLKAGVVEFIQMIVQDLRDPEELVNFCLLGEPGCGKSTIAEIICRIYHGIGLLSPSFSSRPAIILDADDASSAHTETKVITPSPPFLRGHRANMIAGYLGQTSPLTQAMINTCIAQGKILLLDEAYSFGDLEKRDTFAKEVQDCLNRNLTETKLVCAIAGYANEIETMFFAGNRGLESRFPYRFVIDPYSPEELQQILMYKLGKRGWSLDHTTKKLKDVHWWAENASTLFAFAGRSIDTLIGRLKKVHARRVFGKADKSCRRVLNCQDEEEGIEQYVNATKNSKNPADKDQYWKSMYS